MNLRNSRPIPNSDVYRLIKSSIKSANIYDLKSIPKYCDRYVNWILDSKNDIINLDRFKSNNMFMEPHRHLIFSIYQITIGE